MFTGIITEMGKVVDVHRSGGGLRFSFSAPESAKELHVNDSISVNGVCLTVVAADADSFEVEAVEETLRKSTLGEIAGGSRVNLELPVRLQDRLGGHLVLGHVDCVGEIVDVARQANSSLITVQFPAEFARYLVPVGSIAVDGISLTVAILKGNRFTVSIIPHTLEMTTIAKARAGTKVNLEFDIVGKYIERLLPGAGTKVSALTIEKLREWGYGE